MFLSSAPLNSSPGGLGQHCIAAASVRYEKWSSMRWARVGSPQVQARARADGEVQGRRARRAAGGDGRLGVRAERGARRPLQLGWRRRGDPACSKQSLVKIAAGNLSRAERLGTRSMEPAVSGASWALAAALDSGDRGGDRARGVHRREAGPLPAASRAARERGPLRRRRAPGPGRRRLPPRQRGCPRGVVLRASAGFLHFQTMNRHLLRPF